MPQTDPAYQMRLLMINMEPYLNIQVKEKYGMMPADPEQLNECAICLTKYVDEDDLMVLQCDKRHFFHWDCARQWIKIKPSCPLCR